MREKIKGIGKTDDKSSREDKGPKNEDVHKTNAGITQNTNRLARDNANPVSTDTNQPLPIAKIPDSSLPNGVNAPRNDVDPAATNVGNKDGVKNEDDKVDSKDRNFLFYFRRFRYDSPPKSDESDMSDDP